MAKRPATEPARTASAPALLRVPRQRTGESMRAGGLHQALAAIGAQTSDAGVAQLLLEASRRLTGLAMWSWDLATGRLTWSQEMFALIGLPPGPTPTIEQWQQMLHPDDRDDLAASDTASAQAGEGWQVIFRVLPPDGALRYLEAWSDVITDDNGAPVAVLGATMDVTAQQQTLQALQSSREVFRLAFDEAPIGMAMLEVGADSVDTVMVNRALRRLAGLDDGDTEGTEADGAGSDLADGFDLTARVHPEDRATLHALTVVDEDTAHAVRAAELRLVRPDGSHTPIWAHCGRRGVGHRGRSAVPGDPAHDRHDGVAAHPGRAGASGPDRHRDRVGQPVGARGGCPSGPSRHAARAGAGLHAARPRPLQDGERLPGPRRRRCPLGRGRSAAAQRSSRTARPWPGSEATSSPS